MMFGVDTSTNVQLENWAKKLKIEIQVLMADEVEEKLNQKKLSIINYQDSDEKGSHWVGFFNGEKEFDKYYFDPYGIEPLPDFPKCIYNTVQV